MGFDATKAVEPLAYSGMSEFGIPDGVIQEPTNENLAQFFDAILALRDESEGLSGPEALSRAHKATSDLCSGVPTAEQFAALPPRLFRAFVEWIGGEFTGPKG